MWGPPDAVDAAVGLVDHPSQGRAGEVAQLDGLEAGPQPLDRVELRGLGGQALCHQPVPLGRQPGSHRSAAVGGQAVPQQGYLLPAQVAAQLA